MGSLWDLFLLWNRLRLFMKMKMKLRNPPDSDFSGNTSGLYKKYLLQLILGLVLGSLIQLIIPFLTQSIIDIGLNNNDISFIYLILFRSTCPGNRKNVSRIYQGLAFTAYRNQG